MGSKEIPIDQLFKELDENINSSQYKKAIRICNRILTINHSDVEAFHCKVICLIQLGNYQEVLDLLKTQEQMETYSFERIYSQYALAKYNDAIDSIGKLKEKSNQILELEAQIYYKLENYSKTISIYEVLLKQTKYSDSAEFISNLCAVYIDAGKKQECQEVLNKYKSLMNGTYELAFNAACLSLSKGDYKTGETQLKFAKKICIDSLKKDGFTEQEIEDELVSIEVQIAYCHQQQHQLSDSVVKTYESIIGQELEDSASMVAINNLMVLKVSNHEHQTTNTSTTTNTTTSSSTSHEHKELVNYLDQLKSVLEFESKLNCNQKRTLNLNICYLLLQLKRVHQCEEHIKSIKSKSSSSGSRLKDIISDDLNLLESYLYMREKKWRDAEKLLQSGQSLKAKLSLAQLYLLENDIKKSISVFESLDSTTKAKPAIIATMIALYEKGGDLDKAIGSLDQLIKSLESKKNKSEGEEEQYLNLLKVSGNFKMKHHKYQEAAEIYDRVLKLNPNDLIALPSYIIATSHFDPSLSQKYESKLPSIKTDNKVDIDLVEKYGLSYESKVKGATPKPISKAAAAQLKALLKKRKKLTKPTKEYTKPLDPERWLPKWQRAASRNARQKGKKKENDIMRGPQGSSSDSQAQQLFTTGNTVKTPNQNVTPVKQEKARNAHKKKGGKGTK